MDLKDFLRMIQDETQAQGQGVRDSILEQVFQGPQEDPVGLSFEDVNERANALLSSAIEGGMDAIGPEPEVVDYRPFPREQAPSRTDAIMTALAEKLGPGPEVIDYKQYPKESKAPPARRDALMDAIMNRAGETLDNDRAALQGFMDDDRLAFVQGLLEEAKLSSGEDLYSANPAQWSPSEQRMQDLNTQASIVLEPARALAGGAKNLLSALGGSVAEGFPNIRALLSEAMAPNRNAQSTNGGGGWGEDKEALIGANAPWENSPSLPQGDTGTLMRWAQKLAGGEESLAQGAEPVDQLTALMAQNEATKARRKAETEAAANQLFKDTLMDLKSSSSPGTRSFVAKGDKVIGDFDEDSKGQFSRTSRSTEDVAAISRLESQGIPAGIADLFVRQLGARGTEALLTQNLAAQMPKMMAGPRKFGMEDLIDIIKSMAKEDAPRAQKMMESLGFIPEQKKTK